MTFGARPFGTRSFGDGAPSDSLLEAGGGEEFAELSLSGSASFSAVAREFGAVSFDGSGSVTFATTTFGEVAWDVGADFDPKATIEISWSYIQFTGSGRLNVTPQFSGTRRRVIVTDYEGTPLVELENANVGPISYNLNSPETWSFTLPVDDPKLSYITDTAVQEAQLWRGDRLLAWGPMVRPQVSESNVNVTVQGAMWHLGRRHIGKADRTNYVLNGDFEQGKANWGFATNPVHIAQGHPSAQATGPINSIVTFPTVSGVRALALENYVAGADASATQSFLWEVDANTSPDGDQWTLVGYVYVESFDAQAAEGRGLYLERFSTTELNPDPAVQAVLPGAKKSIEHTFVPINEDTPIGVWNRMEIGLDTPVTGEPETINIRLYAPDGQVYWDRVSLTLDERTGFYGVDQAEIAEQIVEHLQDPAYDKSDVNITTFCPLTGVLRDRIYYHSEHPNGLRSIEDFTSLSDGFDVDVAYTPTDRVFRTHFPQKGRYLPRFALETRRNISTFAWTFDGEAAATSVIVLGTGTGSGREEGAAIDTGHFGGLTLEEVFVAPPETRIDSLDNIAEERLVLTTAPEILAIQTLPARGLQADPVGVLEVGDTVPVRIEQGALNINGTYRITSLSINPDDTLSLVLNNRELQT